MHTSDTSHPVFSEPLGSVMYLSLPSVSSGSALVGSGANRSSVVDEDAVSESH